MLAEIATDEIKGYGIDARICISKDEAHNLHGVPEEIHFVCREVEPHKVDVCR